jgi:hypothetical protein
MVWNYRVIKYKNGNFGLHEVYYNDDGVPKYRTADPMVMVDADEGVPAIIHELEMALGDVKNRTVLDDWTPSGLAPEPEEGPP